MSKTLLGESKNTQQKGFKKKLIWTLEHLILPVTLIIIVVILEHYYPAPPYNIPHIQSTPVYNAGPLLEKPDFPFKLDLKSDEAAWLKISIANDGNNYAEDFETNVIFSDNKIQKIDKVYNPPSLDKRIKTNSGTENSFYEMLSYLPANTNIEYTFHLNKLIKSADEFKYYLISKERNWLTSTLIRLKVSHYLDSFQNTAYAEDIVNKEKQPSTPKSGVFLGGYDPVVMSNELFDLVRGKKLITTEDASEVKRVTESNKEGVLFGGINVLKFNEVLINKLFLNKAITREQANRIVDRAQKARGVMVGGYNVIILEVEILNSLLENNKINLKEGQNVIDRSKSSAD